MEKAFDNFSLEVEKVDKAARDLVEDECEINAEPLMDDLQGYIIEELDSKFNNLL